MFQHMGAKCEMSPQADKTFVLNWEDCLGKLGILGDGALEEMGNCEVGLEVLLHNCTS